MSTIKSSSEDLTLNADGSNEVKFQINAVEKASINSSGLFTSTTIDATKLTGNLPTIDGSSLTGISALSDTYFIASQEAHDNNVTGDGTTYTVVWDTERFDSGTVFDGTSTFTAPTAGKYLFIARLSLGNLVINQDRVAIRINTSNRYYQNISDAYESIGNDLGTFSVVCFTDMDASDTAVVTIWVDNHGSDEVDIYGATAPTDYNSFMGVKLA